MPRWWLPAFLICVNPCSSVVFYKGSMRAQKRRQLPNHRLALQMRKHRQPIRPDPDWRLAANQRRHILAQRVGYLRAGFVHVIARQRADAARRLAQGDQLGGALVRLLALADQSYHLAGGALQSLANRLLAA